jgi:hypothetical protein
MSFGCITSRPWKPWPQIRWVVRERLALVEETNGEKRYDRECYEDYVLDWPWMQCRGSSGARTDTAETNEQHGLLATAVRALEEARATFPN